MIRQCDREIGKDLKEACHDETAVGSVERGGGDWDSVQIAVSEHLTAHFPHNWTKWSDHKLS